MAKGTELLGRFKPGDNLPVFATGTDINAGHFVTISGKNAKGAYIGAHTGAGLKASGVAEVDAIAGKTDWRGSTNLGRRGSVARVVMGAAVTVGDDVGSDATGRAVRVPAIAAHLDTGVVADNNAIVWTAIAPGGDGDDITVTIIDPAGNNVALSVDVDGTDIIVTGATDGSSALTSTATLVRAAIAEHDVASQLVTTANKGASTGAGVVTAVAETPLAGGGDAGAALGRFLGLNKTVGGNATAANQVGEIDLY